MDGSDETDGHHPIEPTAPELGTDVELDLPSQTPTDGMQLETRGQPRWTEPALKRRENHRRR